MNAMRLGNVTQDVPIVVQKELGVSTAMAGPRITDRATKEVSQPENKVPGAEVLGDLFRGKNELRKALGEINETARVFNIRLRFQVDMETGETSVLVIDLDRGVVIRKIPPAKALDLAYSLYDMVGLLFDEIV